MDKKIFLNTRIIILFLYICFFFGCNPENQKELSEINNGMESAPFPESAFESPDIPELFYVKTAPFEILIKCDGEMLNSTRDDSGIRLLVSSLGSKTFEFSAPGYLSQYINSGDIPSLLRKGVLQVKLEPETDKLKLLQEIASGSQPKSVVFSANGRRVFVPLLNERGVDVFSFSPENKDENNSEILKFEKRLRVPDKDAKGFVEGLIDKTRNEFWVSNMNDNCVHIFDSETLAYKTSVPTQGRMSKVIAQSPNKEIVAVSNWLTRDITFISAENKKVLFKVSVKATPRGMAFSPDGSLLYVSIFDEPEIGIIDIYKRETIKYFNLYEGYGAFRHVLYNDKKLYVSDMARGRINIIEAESGKLIRSAYVGSNINTITFSPDRKLIFISSRGKNNPEDYTLEGPEFGSVSVFSADNLSLLGRVWGRNQPTGLDISPDGKYMIFSDFLDANLELYEIGKF